MKVGDLVKRSGKWIVWIKDNQPMHPLLTKKLRDEIGMITDLEDEDNFSHIVVVLWHTYGLSWEDFDDLEVINENR